MAAITSKVLPKHTYAVMVHKLYADRVKTFLYGLESDWIVLGDEHHYHHHHKDTADANAKNTNTSRRVHVVETLDTPTITGVSQARRGYVLLLLQNVPQEIAKLSPFARQNISWVGRITHHQLMKRQEDDATSASILSLLIQTNKNSSSNDNNSSSTIGSIIWENFRQGATDGSFELKKMRLRVDCHPRTITKDVCLQLQKAAAAAAAASHNGNSDNDDDDVDIAAIITDPFEGPIPMTMSRSKCTHRLTVILLANNSSSSSTTTTLYWGFETSRNVIDMKLNHEASNEIRIVPANNQTGADRIIDGIDCDTAPLSRAYYKLQQVIMADDYCHLGMQNTKVAAFAAAGGGGGAGLDLGAAPGGWTQVLVAAGFRPVVAVDAAKLADRVTKLPQVRHVPSCMESADNLLPSSCCCDDDDDGLQLYSIVVCDACVKWVELLDLLLKVLSKTANQWTVPAFAVITMKLPYKTLGSIQNHIQSIHNKMPRFLNDMCEIMYPETVVVRPAYRLVHLMANSDSERTLIAKFDGKQ